MSCVSWHVLIEGRKIEKDEVILWRWRVEGLWKAEVLFAFGNVPKGVGGMRKGMDGRVGALVVA